MRNLFKIKIIVCALAGLSAIASAAENSPSAFIIEQVKKAINHSPEIQRAGADKEAAGWDIDQVKAQRWPQVQLGGTSPLAGSGRKGSIRENMNASNLSLSVNTTLYDWGKTSAQIAGAEYLEAASAYNVSSVNEQIAYSTLTELMNLDRYQKQQTIAKSYVARMNELTRMLEAIIKVDPGRSNELTQARSKLLAAQSAQENIDNALHLSKIKLLRLTGEEMVIPAGLTWGMPRYTAKQLREGLRYHPVLLKARAETNAARAQASAVEASRYPQINWSVSKIAQRDSSGHEGEWATGINLQWKVFSGGAQKAAHQAARARANGSEQQYHQASLDMQHQINDLVQTRDSSRLQAKNYQALAAESEKVSKIFFDQWLKLGKRTLLDVLTAENDHFNHQLTAVNQQYDGEIANVKLMASTAVLLRSLNLAQTK
ncbi:TolC family protein [Pantoea endophytica]|uniref:TolC family protein n=1 Tax=Pantoea endophytica TaxID=92488 RepID=UPI0030181F2C